jgi:hypothetical protein
MCTVFRLVVCCSSLYLQRNLFARNLHKRAERKEREREERKPIFQEDVTAGKGGTMDMDTFLDIGADDDEETPGRGPGAL